MLHLHTERLAALSDEPPTPDEATHLASCDACARERRAFDTLCSIAAAERDAFALPLTRWDSIAIALAVESSTTAGPAPVVGRSNRRMLRIAAGFLLVAGGTIMGRMTAGARALPEGLAQTAVVPADDPALLAARGNPDSAFFDSVDDARAKQQRAELVYQQATAFLARYDTAGGNVAGTPAAYRSRLAALDRVISTTHEAMRAAPHDPVINGYYLTTLGQREATLRQLNTALPSSLRVNSF